MIYCYTSTSFNPYHNLAIEDFFIDFVNQNPLHYVLYFWQNENTVVIGRNQDAFSECNVENLSIYNAFLARRKTGGGAVFHDKNNLNFSFVTPIKTFDKNKSMEIIKSALLKLGFNAEISGRNDVLVNGAKCSGSAYYAGKNVQLHHGTILIDTNIDLMKNLLKVNSEKLKSKGVKSVASRVVNLREIIPSIELEDIKVSLKESFVQTYNFPVEKFNLNDFDISEKEAFFMDENWIYGNKKFSDVKSYEKKFDWGLCTLKIVDDFRAVKIYSDALEYEKIAAAQEIISEKKNVACSDKIICNIIDFYNEITSLL